MERFKEKFMDFAERHPMLVVFSLSAFLWFLIYIALKAIIWN